MRIILCGDLLFSSRNLLQRLEQPIVNILTSADAVCANAEFSTPNPLTPPGLCMYLTSVKPKTLEELAELNIKLVSFANNHTADYGWQGALETMEAAEACGLIPCGIGRNLEQARKARFLDTPKGRVGMVAACSTWSERALASMPGADTAARPGLSPLRWSVSYVLPDLEFESLKHIDEILGTRESMREVSRVETWKPLGENQFKFGSAMQGNLLIERGERPEVRTWVHASDQEALLKSIRDAARRSDVTIATLHTHEGINENWYAAQPPAFVEEFARKAIDAGAAVFVGQGAHFSRGVEIYKGRPIFYNLGSLIMEFEAGESMISPEMYHTYGLASDARPSDLHCGRAKDENGNWSGFYSERRFSKNFFVIMDLEDGHAEYRIVPIDLDMHNENNLKRGLPVIADEAVAQEFVQDLTRSSEKYGTRFSYDAEEGCIKFFGCPSEK
ncbi:MAG: CapA family protein [Lawsonibacter sp.]|nr:CapA family protein [Lawsonibacter sp.]